MTSSRKILVVAPTPALASTLVRWLGEAKHELVLVTTFAAAKLHLRTKPELVITEVRLGEYNGLHVALRARSAGVPAIVLGPADEVCGREAAELGGAYLNSSALDYDELLSAVDRCIESAQEHHRLQHESEDEAGSEGFTFDPFASPPGVARPSSRPVVLH